MFFCDNTWFTIRGTQNSRVNRGSGNLIGSNYLVAAWTYSVAVERRSWRGQYASVGRRAPRTVAVHPGCCALTGRRSTDDPPRVSVWGRTTGEYVNFRKIWRKILFQNMRHRPCKVLKNKHLRAQRCSRNSNLNFASAPLLVEPLVHYLLKSEQTFKVS